MMPDIGAAFQVADDGKPVFLRHIEIENHKVRHRGVDRPTQALTTVAKAVTVKPCILR